MTGGGAFAIWLIPSEPIRGRLAGEVHRLAIRLGTVPFDPHLTLVGGLRSPEADVVSAAGILAASVLPVGFEMGRAGGLPEIFRALYVEVEPSAGLLAARRRAVELLPAAEGTDFHPHVSLVYGELGERERKEWVKRIGERWRGPAAAGALEVRWIEGRHPGSWRRAARFIPPKAAGRGARRGGGDPPPETGGTRGPRASG
jgi:2'-5' RNA ligase